LAWLNRRLLGRNDRRSVAARRCRAVLPYREVVRAKMVLRTAEGLDNGEIAARLDTRREIASKWRKRFFEQALSGFEERPRGGRPPVFPSGVVVAVKAFACEWPGRLGVPLSRLHVPDIATEVVRRGRPPRNRRRDLGDQDLALAVRGRDPTVEAAAMDLSL